MQFIQQLEDMKSQIIVKGSDLELKKIAEEYNMELTPEILERLFLTFNDCDNVRQINNLIQDTFAFNSIFNEIC